MKDVITPLGDLVFVMPIIRSWTGTKTIDRADVQANAPKGLVSGFQILLIDPAELAPLTSVRSSVRRVLARLGVQIESSLYALPADKEGEMHRAMDELKLKHKSELDAIALNLGKLYQDQEDKYPGFEHLLQRFRISAAELVSRCSFDYTLFRVQPSATAEGAQRYQALAESTVPALVDGINQQAAHLLKDSFAASTVGQKAVNPVRRMLEKMRGYAAFDPRIIPATDALQSVLDGVPKSGLLSPSQTLIVASILSTLSDPDCIVKTAASAPAESNRAPELPFEQPVATAATAPTELALEQCGTQAPPVTLTDTQPDPAPAIVVTTTEGKDEPAPETRAPAIPASQNWAESMVMI